MRIIFVRHGHPNYEKDCLTALGHRHAAAAAERLWDEGITAIYSSTCGRAMETAGHLADVLGLPVQPCDFMREVSWGPTDTAPMRADGFPWSVADAMVAANEPLVDLNWQERDGFMGNKLLHHTDHIATASDQWLSVLGYTRESLYYRAGENTKRTIAAFGHGGESAAMLSHLFNLPLPIVCTAMDPNYTGITIVEFPDRPGELVSPRFELMNDARHIRGMTVENIFGN